MDLKDLEENVRVRVGAADKVSAERLRVCTRMMSVHGNCHFSLNPGLSSTFFFFFSGGRENFFHLDFCFLHSLAQCARGL